MKYICEIDVPWDGEDWRLELYCGKECNWLEDKENRNGSKYPFCNVFRKKLKLDIMPYELPAIFRCDECRYVFYPAPDGT
jgi:hypothetical protein